MDQVTGILTHRLIAVVIAILQEDYVEDIPLMLLARGTEIIDAEPNLGAHRARIRVRSITAAGQYIYRYCPAPPSRFIGSEQPVSHGRVDLSWRHPDLGVFFDEIKTARNAHQVQGNDLAQLTKYVHAGVDLFGDEFAGVRYLPLLNPGGAVLATANGPDRIFTKPLALTPLALDTIAKAVA